MTPFDPLQDPASATFRRNRGLCHRNRGAYQLAVEDFSAVLTDNPWDFATLSNRG
jgi:hypothetical protein